MSESPSSSAAKSFPSPLPNPNFRATDHPLTEDCDVLVIGLFEDEPLTPVAKQSDEALGGVISRLITQDKLSRESGDLMRLPGPAAIASDGSAGPKLVQVVGLGKREKLDRKSAFELTSTAIRALVQNRNDAIVVALAECFESSDHDAVVGGALYALEGQSIYRTKSPINVPVEICFAGIETTLIERGRTLGEAVNHTRRLVNEPAAAIYPESFAKRVAVLAKEVGLEAEIWDEQKLEQENCRAILAVGSGSARPPRLLILRHQGGPADEPPIALVGKGVTFDSGGLSLKPSDGMVDMKCDMAGAATVAGAMLAVSRLGIRKNVIGFCGLAENMVSGNSYKLGDVIQTRSGKTIEILNTDAEGRVVLSDTLDVAIEHKPSAMVDLATLTGACMVALGTDVVGAMANDQTVCDAILNAAKLEGEPLWQLPMFELYDEKVKSKVADIRNIGEGRWGGAITAAKFLENFVGDTPWVHLDIAGPAFTDSPKPHRDAGASGVMLRTLVRWIESQ
jgi:leucyl aminopeptidase